MSGLAAVGDAVQGGVHPHGQLGPAPSPGTIITGATRVFVQGRLVARDGDTGYSPACCGGIGKIVVHANQVKVFVESHAAVGAGASSVHCDIAPGTVVGGSSKVAIP